MSQNDILTLEQGLRIGIRMTTKILKGTWLTALDCNSKAWFEMRDEPAALGEADLFRMEQSREIGELGQRLFPAGRLVTTQDGKTPMEVTQDLLADESIETLFEATFVYGPFMARADIITRRDGAWHLLGVKSSFSDTGNLAELTLDVAYTVLVSERAGFPFETISLMLLSREYRFGDGPERLFETVDVSAQVRDRLKEFRGSAEKIAEALLSGTRPKPVLVSTCRSCTYFESKCLGKGLESTVLDLPALHHTKLKRLSTAGIVDLSQVPGDLELNERQERAKYSALSGNVVIETSLGEALKSIVWPCYYLDFETVASVMPLYEGHGCHQQVLTQFSIHYRKGPERELRHSEYLAEASRESERELAETLIQVLGASGSVMVYSHFEKTRIADLKKRFSDLAPQLQRILDRLVDLMPIVQDHVYHPEFRGSFSIKTVLPALIPDLSYKGQVVGDGNIAIMKFAQMARGQIVGERVKETRNGLLEYCKLDTLAMVRLHEVLIDRAASRRRAGTA
jgi:hypothetical protein